MNRRNLPYEALFTEKKGQAAQLAREAAEREEPDKVIVAMGGDGTISEVMDGIWDHPEVTFAYIPIGSGNDFARSLGISTSWRKALEGILSEKHRIMLHPGRMEFNGRVRHFGGSMGIGFDAAVCDGANRLRFKSVFNDLGVGKYTYTGVALKLLVTSDCDKLKIRMDGQEVHRFRNVLFLCALKGKYEGGGFMFAPDAELDDEYLHINVAESIPIFKRFFLLPKALKGKHLGAEGIHSFRCKELEIVSSAPKLIHGDGEVSGPVTKIKVSLEPTAIPMVY
jgi:YegS/Rv2252/BmrU family lipid kinase